MPDVSFSPDNEQRARLYLFLLVFLPFLLVLPPLLQATGTFTFENYVLTSFVWLLVTAEIFAPDDLATTWWRRLGLIRALAWLLVGWILFQRIAAVLA